MGKKERRREEEVLLVPTNPSPKLENSPGVTRPGSS
jgi:hypothetical protein